MSIFVKLMVVFGWLGCYCIPFFTCAQHHPHTTVRIAWDYGSMQQLADRGGYPRLHRLQDGSAIVVYENYSGDILFKRTTNGGTTWSPPGKLFTSFETSSPNGSTTRVHAANPEITQLPSGKIWVVCNLRPQKPGIYPFSIAIKELRLSGQPDTARILFRGGNKFQDGCWEPAFLQLPGELQLYFANESPYRASNEQEISMLWSPDSGMNWSARPKTVSFRAGKRDGMPVPVLLDDKIVVAIEDNGFGQFKPFTVRTGVQENWKTPVIALSPRREPALAKPVPDSVYMGAPYLIVLPNGQTLLSYQTTGGRTPNWELSTMEVAIGDRKARNFMRQTRPFLLPPAKQAKWNSLALWDSTTVVALSSTNVSGTGVSPWLIKGYLVPDTLPASQALLDKPLFIGSTSSNQLRAGFIDKGDSLIVQCVVTGRAAGVTLYYTYNGERRRIKADISRSGEKLVGKTGGRETTISLEPPAGDVANSGTIVRFAILKPEMAGDIQVGLALHYIDHDGDVKTERLVHLQEERPETWIQARFALRGSNERMRQKSDAH